LVLDTAPVWDAARAFYASAGYVEIARRQRNGFDLIFMENNLATGSKQDIEPNHRVAVRAATLSDVSAIADLHLASWRTAYRGIVPEAYLRDVTLEGRQARWRRALSAPESRHTDTLVAADGDDVVGVCSFGPRQDGTASTGEIHSLHIQPEQRRAGLGTLLLNNAIRRLAERGFVSAVLWVLEANAGARQFYEVLGWLPTGEQRVESRDGHAIPEVRYTTVLPYTLLREE
jgi:ribosomal protein S18 acetylase RimI-like enzyme